MNTDIKNEWVAALRSGEYDQGNRVLRDINDSYCCLGVLCDIAAKHGIGKWSKATRPDSREYFVFGNPDLFETNCSFLPVAVRAWAGLDTDNGLLSQEVAGELSLTRLNDVGIPFDVIASVIEDQF